MARTFLWVWIAVFFGLFLVGCGGGDVDETAGLLENHALLQALKMVDGSIVQGAPPTGLTDEALAPQPGLFGAPIELKLGQTFAVTMSSLKPDDIASVIVRADGYVGYIEIPARFVLSGTTYRVELFGKLVGEDALKGLSFDLGIAFKGKNGNVGSYQSWSVKVSSMTAMNLDAFASNLVFPDATLETGLYPKCSAAAIVPQVTKIEAPATISPGGSFEITLIMDSSSGQVSSALFALPYTQGYQKVPVEANTGEGTTSFTISGLLSEEQGLFATKISVMVALSTVDGQTGVYRDWSFRLEDGGVVNPSDCDDEDPCTVDEKVGDECQNTPKDCSDAYECTEDLCDTSSGDCSNEPKEGFCLIDGECYENGAAKSDDPCSVCNDRLDPLGWSAALNGQSCDPGDDLPCTTGICLAGICEKRVKTTHCLIDGSCYALGDANSSNECELCGQAAREAWSSKDDGTACGDGNQCVAGDCLDCFDLDGCADVANDLECATIACEENACSVDAAGRDGEACTDDGLDCTFDLCNAFGVCSHNTIRNNTCYIGGACYTRNQENPSEPCQSCRMEDPWNWSNKNDGAVCSDGDQCLSGSCVECVDDSGCFDLDLEGRDLECTARRCISNACVFEHFSEATACQVDGEGDGSDQCDGGGFCLDCLDVSACTEVDTSEMECAETVCEGNVCLMDLDAHDGEPCTEDGVNCTTDVCNAQGECTHVTGDDACIIGDQCYSDGEVRPDSPCQVCDVEQNRFGWTLLADGAVCGDGDQCTGGICKDCYDLTGCEDYDWGTSSRQCGELSCSGGACVFNNLPPGFPCKPDGSDTATDQCNAEGACVDCTNLNGCSDLDMGDKDDECAEIACDPMTFSCGFVLPDEPGGGCKVNGTWDGQGLAPDQCTTEGLCIDCIDDEGCANRALGTGIDGECARWSCVDSACEMDFEPIDTFCERGGPVEGEESDLSDQCDGAGHCIDCTSGSGCMDMNLGTYDAECVSLACLENECGYDFEPAETPCQSNGTGDGSDQCDGSGYCSDCLTDSGCADLDWGSRDSECSDRVCSVTRTCRFADTTESDGCSRSGEWNGQGVPPDQCGPVGQCLDCVNIDGCYDVELAGRDEECINRQCLSNVCQVSDLADGSACKEDGVWDGQGNPPDQCKEGYCHDCIDLNGCTDLPDDGLECTVLLCDEEVCRHDAQTRAGDTCTDDGLSCTVDSCSGEGVCEHDTVIPGTCLIDGVCYNHLDANPENTCQYCDSPTSCGDECAATRREWQTKYDGIACGEEDHGQCKDGACVECVYDFACSYHDMGDLDSECASWLCNQDTNTCYLYIASEMFGCKTDGEWNGTGSPPDVCDDAGHCIDCYNVDHCSEVADDGIWCTTLECVDHQCTQDTLVDETCYIDGECHYFGTEDTSEHAKRCGWCQADNRYDWTPKTWGTSCSTNDQCDGEGNCVDCVQADVACEDLSWGERDQECTIKQCNDHVCEFGDYEVGTTCEMGSSTGASDECNGEGLCVDCTSDSGCGDLYINTGIYDRECVEPACNTPSNSCYVDTDIYLDESCNDDGYYCTIDLCDSQGTCTHDTPLEGHCFIESQCWAEDDRRGSVQNDSCLYCKPGAEGGSFGWSDVPSQTACWADAYGCTIDVCNGGGTCTHDQIADGTCFIGSTCYDEEGLRSSVGNYTCQVCRPDGAGGQRSWTLKDSGESCTMSYTCPDETGCVEGETCTSTSCNAWGSCLVDEILVGCFIDSSCWSDGDRKESAGDDNCRACDPSGGGGASDWSVLTDGTYCVDALSCTENECSSGACVVNSVTTGCYIDDACWTDGDIKTASGADACLVCRETEASQEWSWIADDTDCDDDDDTTVEDICTSGVCVGREFDMNWIELSYGTKPSERAYHDMEYDAAHDEIVLFGGLGDGNAYLNDTWKWTEEGGWSQLSPTGDVPEARYGHKMVYFAKEGDEKIVLFGGLAESGDYSSETWIWNGSVWTELDTTTNPEGCYGHTMVYDETHEVIVLFGGRENYSYSNSTWLFDGSEWSQASPSQVPDRRYNASMVYHPDDGTVLMFGGYRYSNFNDTWIWNGGTGNWQEISPSSHPGADSRMDMFFDLDRRRIVYLEGDTRYNWEWTGSTWTRTAADSRVDSRRGFSIAYIPGLRVAVMFGGSYYNEMKDTWLYARDTDYDGIANDGSLSGTVGDEPCTDGQTQGCDDNCSVLSNADQANMDDDTLGDICDPDRDNDGKENEEDNCPNVSNADQANRDSDGVGDVCDNCPDHANAGQEDQDGDGVGNVCDNCPTTYNVNQANRDSDEWGDACDNCPDDDNSGQEDQDGDDLGDICDPDRDGDGMDNGDDNCPDDANSGQEDMDGDDIGDVCDPDRDGDGTDNDADNCPDNYNADQADEDDDEIGNACDEDYFGLVKVPAGSFAMGSSSSEIGHRSDETMHTVTLTRDFLIGRTEVTQEQFATVLSGGVYNPSYFTSCGDACPVEDVNWFEAVAYANKLSESEDLIPCYTITNWECTAAVSVASPYDCFSDENQGFASGTVELNGVATPYECEGYRLPTEAEWEYAARGLKETSLYIGEIESLECSPVDTLVDEIGWMCDTRTYQVGQKTLNYWGLADTCGNVREWIGDWYRSDYENDLSTDPFGPVDGELRVLRSSSYQMDSQYCRLAFRDSVGSAQRSRAIGFRIARTAP